MTWAGRRQAVIIGVAIIIVLAIIFPFAKKIIAPTATCTDGRQNGGELGVDCSGPCNKICPFEATAASVLWVRPFNVAEGVVSAVAYISNPNPSYEAKAVRYTMRVYDEKNLLVAERYGTTDIPAKSTFPVFEGGMESGKSTVKTAYFEFLDEPNWQKSTESGQSVSLGAPVLTTDPLPKISVKATNNGAASVKNVSVVAVVYDADGNSIASSQTVIDKLDKNESTDLVFTWALPFDGISSRIEVYPRIPLN